MTDIEHPVNLRQMPAKAAGEFRSTNLLIPHALMKLRCATQVGIAPDRRTAIAGPLEGKP